MKSREEAIEWAKRAPAPHPNGEGEIEIVPFSSWKISAPSEAIDRARELGKELGKRSKDWNYRRTIMKFLSIYKTVERNTPSSQEEMDCMGKLDRRWHEGRRICSPWRVASPAETGARVRLSNGSVTVTDGPFTESKEVIGGFADSGRTRKKRPFSRTKRLSGRGGRWGVRTSPGLRSMIQSSQ